VRVKGDGSPQRNESEVYPKRKLQGTPNRSFMIGLEYEHCECDPKDGELCLCRVKPEEILVEARSGIDVQIIRQTWV